MSPINFADIERGRKRLVEFSAFDIFYLDLEPINFAYSYITYRNGTEPIKT